MLSADDLPPPDDTSPVRRALISVFDKTGVADLGRRLHAHGVELISTGGTAEALRAADLPVTDVADLTGRPAMLGGRVKTLHPAIHAGLLARRGVETDMEALDDAGYAPIDLVVANLYPFEEAVAADAGVAEAAENIDIGGPTMIRAAAKNHFAVGVVTAPDQYAALADELDAHDGALTLATRQRLATSAFEHTARYDAAIHQYLTDTYGPPTDDADAEEPPSSAADAEGPLPARYHTSLPQVQALRYGENPHQDGALYGRPDDFFTKLHGKALSYNNLMDLSAALLLIDEFQDAGPTCAILKHTNPSGVATADTLKAAYRQAFATDRQSPYGGIIVVNQALDRATAEAIDEIFTEIIIAPAFEDGVLDFLQEKASRRVVESRQPGRADDRLQLRSVLGGLLVQTSDPVLPPADALRERWSVPTQRAPSDAEAADLDFAWRVVKHVKSNAIVYARDQATLGIGAGQMSRIDASELAVRKAGKSDLDLDGSVIASDAFFPFADGLEAAADVGARAAIQPGGSIRDEDVIDAADAHDMAMVLTGQRHFRH
jgi:phosphoribosylaminoimidazolecarboxamide formyltransferase/IMP cyclohydrolase